LKEENSEEFDWKSEVFNRRQGQMTKETERKKMVNNMKNNERTHLGNKPGHDRV